MTAECLSKNLLTLTLFHSSFYPHLPSPIEVLGKSEWKGGSLKAVSEEEIVSVPLISVNSEGEVCWHFDLPFRGWGKKFTFLRG